LVEKRTAFDACRFFSSRSDRAADWLEASFVVVRHGYLEGYAGYAAAKEAIRSLTRTAAHEWGQFNIHVNVIAPAAMTASMMNAMDAKKREMILERFPSKRFGDPEKTSRLLSSSFAAQPSAM